MLSCRGTDCGGSGQQESPGGYRCSTSWLNDTRALHLVTPNWRLLHHLLRAEERNSEHRIACCVLSRPGQGSVSSFLLCVEEMLHGGLSLNGVLNEDS